MAIRLVKIAKELNVGTSTIVEYLISKGFEIDNKPTSKISEEMHSTLLKEFSTSMAVKEQADQIVIGNRVTKEEEVVAPKPVFKLDLNPKPIVETPKEEPKAEVESKSDPIPETKPVKEVPSTESSVTETVKEESTEDNSVEVPTVKKSTEEEVIRATAPKSGLKVKGKIDLNPPKPVVEKKEKIEVKKKEPKVVAETKKDEKPEAKPEAAPEKSTDNTKDKEAEKAPNQEVMRPDAPTLQGLKILGKIDTKKFEPKKKEKKEEAKPGTAGNANKSRRPRTRKKVTPQGNRPNQSQGQRGGRGAPRRGAPKKNDELKTVTKKEIEDKIKATMARISGGGRNKRQKIRRDSRDQKREKQEIKEQEKETGTLKLTEFISVSEFASLMDVSATDVITKCMSLGVIVSINQRLDAEIIELVGTEFGFEIEFIDVESQSEEEEEIVDDPADLVPRAPIVTVMGHVDHGKTSLLDYIRDAKVASGEAGGITQHIGAYEVEVGESNKRITFLDTPGHEAFTAMRARGAKVTDVVIVIVAADDRVMPQTKEAISHAQAAGVPMIFAINKIDKDGADTERVKAELAEMGLQVEDWGGKFQSQDISAKTGENIELLLEKIVLEAELLELQANPSRNATGAVLEASLDKGRGYVTKVLIQTGTLKVGDPFVAGSHSGKVKAMFNDRGKRIKKAGPSVPVMVLGLNGAPQAGEKLKVTETEQEAKALAVKRSQIEREQSNRASKRISLDEIGRRIALGAFKELNLIVKGDVDGSIEALSDSLIKLSQETVQVNVIHKAVGQIIESDVLLASASDAIVIGFQVRPSQGARQLAEKEGVQIKTYSIIYEVIDEIKLAIEGLLEPTKEEVITAQVEIREIFKISKIGTIAGCFVTEGKIARNSKIRIIREGIVVYPIKEGATGELSSLKRFKDDVKEVRNGMECGASIKNYNDIKEGDVIEAYEIKEIKQKLK